jgi:hypothetical protein
MNIDGMNKEALSFDEIKGWLKGRWGGMTEEQRKALMGAGIGLGGGTILGATTNKWWWPLLLAAAGGATGYFAPKAIDAFTGAFTGKGKEDPATDNQEKPDPTPDPQADQKTETPPPANTNPPATGTETSFMPSGNIGTLTGATLPPALVYGKDYNKHVAKPVTIFDKALDPTQTFEYNNWGTRYNGNFVKNPNRWRQLTGKPTRAAILSAGTAYAGDKIYDYFNPQADQKTETPLPGDTTKEGSKTNHALMVMRNKYAS